METYGMLHDVLHSVMTLMLWWGAVSILGGAIFSLLRMGDRSEQLVLAHEAGNN